MQFVKLINCHDRTVCYYKVSAIDIFTQITKTENDLIDFPKHVKLRISFSWWGVNDTLGDAETAFFIDESDLARLKAS